MNGIMKMKCYFFFVYYDKVRYSYQNKVETARKMYYKLCE